MHTILIDKNEVDHGCNIIFILLKLHQTITDIGGCQVDFFFFLSSKIEPCPYISYYNSVIQITEIFRVPVQVSYFVVLGCDPLSFFPWV